MSRRRPFLLKIYADGGHTEQLAQDAVGVATQAAVALDDARVTRVEIIRRETSK